MTLLLLFSSCILNSDNTKDIAGILVRVQKAAAPVHSRLIYVLALQQDDLRRRRSITIHACGGRYIPNNHTSRPYLSLGARYALPRRGRQIAAAGGIRDRKHVFFPSASLPYVRPVRRLRFPSVPVTAKQFRPLQLLLDAIFATLRQEPERIMFADQIRTRAETNYSIKLPRTQLNAQVSKINNATYQ